MPIGSPEEELERADAVFVGTITEFFGSSAGNRIAIFHVEEAWKGVTKTSVTVRTGPNGMGGCGYNFYEDRFLVYAYRNGGRLVTSICTRTAPVSETAEDLAYLRTQPTIGLSPTIPPLILLLGLVLSVETGIIVVTWWQGRPERPAGAAEKSGVASTALIGAAIGSAITGGLLGLLTIALTSGSIPMPATETAIVLINGLLSGAIAGAVLGILIRLSTEQSHSRTAILGRGAVIGLFVGPVVLMLYGSISTLIMMAVLNMSETPEAFSGNGGCLLGPAIGLMTGLLIAAVIGKIASRQAGRVPQ
jgi:hypothetical protein